MLEHTAPLYFAYGSNLNGADWRAFCVRKGFDPECLRPEGPAMLPDFALCFDYFSEARHGGALDLIPARGHVVHGMLFRPVGDGWTALARKEGSPFIYEPFRWTAIRNDGYRVPVLTFRVTAAYRGGFVPPSSSYIEALENGLEEHDLPVSPLRRAAADEAPQAELDTLFAYGTLMRGECRFMPVADNGLYAETPARVRGRLHAISASLPALCLIDDLEEQGYVEGDLQRFDDLPATLCLLDSVEGFVGYAPNAMTASLYHRSIVPVSVRDDRETFAWTYVAADPHIVGPVIESGCWRTHQGRQRQLAPERC